MFVGDAGETEAEPRRAGAAASSGTTTTRATPWLLLDADLACSHARFTDADPAGDHIPGAVERVASVGVTVADLGPWFGQFQLRYFGPRPLIEDNSVALEGDDAGLPARRLQDRRRTCELALDVFNLFDRKASDIDYFYASRLPGEAGRRRRRHPLPPGRAARACALTLTANF